MGIILPLKKQGSTPVRRRCNVIIKDSIKMSECRTLNESQFGEAGWCALKPSNSQNGENNDPSLTLALLTKRSSYDTTAIIRPLTPRRSDLKA